MRYSSKSHNLNEKIMTKSLIKFCKKKSKMFQKIIFEKVKNFKIQVELLSWKIAFRGFRRSRVNCAEQL